MQTVDLWQKLAPSFGVLLDHRLARLAVCDVLPHIDCTTDLDGSQPDGILQCVTSLQRLFGRSVALTAEDEHLSLAGRHTPRTCPKRHQSDRRRKFDLRSLLVVAQMSP